MITSQDLQILKEAGIDSPDLVVSAAAAFLRAHPVIVQRFFLQELTDLVSDVAGTTLSPRDWLIVGHDVESIMVLARDI